MGKRQINCSIDSIDYVSFQAMYPQMLTRFVSRCVRRALESRDFFSDVCFSPLKSEIDSRFDLLKDKAKEFPIEEEIY
ncbi:MAG: hypothetical protein K2F89_09615 [Treponemataceae bacterium]|nr:hypothetical protein [Treponemataceae bacterium]